ncbi:MFS transporter [Solihabitans fulvus]|uniref:MFS transporter n=1 Tax=Solihabitans fulvus TaxID=1892852 RepID=UPI001CB75D45|nr:MFS transporter [Solihabitans fulvus]
MGDVGARRWWGLGALALSALAIGLDLTVLNVALPTLATQLHADTAGLQWIANGYTLVLAAVLLPAGLLGDRLGRKRLMIGALVVFGVASAGCAYASTTGQLIAARALLGLGGAFLLPLCLSMVSVLFTADERQRALTVFLTANAIGIPLGPLVGGWLLDHFWWGSVFLINVPMVVIALAAVALLLPESRSAVPPTLDLPSVLLSSVGLVAFTYGVIRAGQHGWGEALTLTTLLGGAAVLTAFVLRQRGRTRRGTGALIDLALFRSASFSWGTALATMTSFGMFGVLFTVPQYFQAVGGADALGTGLRLLPVIGGLLVGARVASRFAARIGAKITVAVGFAVQAGGLMLGATTEVTSGEAFSATWLALVGVGLGFAMPTTMDAALGELSPEHSGVGSALIQALRQVGGAIGVALLGTVLSATYRNGLDLTGVPATAADTVRDSAAGGIAVAHRLGSTPLLDSVRGAFTNGMDVMLWVCGGVSVLGVAFALAFLPVRAARAEPEPAVV